MTAHRQQPAEKNENESVFARGLHAFRVVKKAATDLVDGFGEKAEQEKQLFILSGSGNAKALNAMLDTGVDPRALTQSKFGTEKAWTPLHRALANNDEASSFALVQAIRQRFSPLEASVAINAAEGQYGDSPLMMAVKLNQSHTFQALMSAGADPSQSNKEGVTPFMEMCRRGSMEMVKNTCDSLDQGKTSVMLHKVDAAGMNSLFHAIAGAATEEMKIEMIALHAAKNFDCSGKYGPEGYSAVHVASLVGQPTLIRDLVGNHGGDVNSLSTKEGLTPTMVAGWSNQPDSVKMLSSYPQTYLDAKRDSDGSTALHMAGVRGHQDVIIALVQCNADLQAKNAQNQTPAELAKYLGQNETTQLLKRLDPHSDVNTTLTQSLLQRAGQAVNALKPATRASPNL